MKNIMVRLLSVGFFAGLLAGSAVAAEALFKSAVVGSVPGQTIGGVGSAGARWVVSKGEAELDKDGRLRVEVEGLILPSLGTAGPVTHVRASLVCGGSGGMVVVTTGAVPLSPAGDAKVDEDVTLPSICFGPVVLVRIAGLNGTVLPAPVAWIAATGF